MSFVWGPRLVLAADDHDVSFAIGEILATSAVICKVPDRLELTVATLFEE